MDKFFTALVILVIGLCAIAGVLFLVLVIKILISEDFDEPDSQ